MPINISAAMRAAAVTAAISWTLCSAAVALGLASTPAVVLANLFHLRMPMAATGSSLPGSSMMAGSSMMTFSVTWGGFFIGLIVWSVVSGLIAGLFGAVYNRHAK